MRYPDDLTGMRFGKLVVVGRAGTDVRYGAIWKCKCDCGNTIDTPRAFLVMGGRTSCGCNHFLDLTGRRFGKLTVMHESGKTKSGNYIWHCKCDCGMELNVVSSDLVKNRKHSCGCDSPHNLVGRKFGKLTVLNRVNVPGPSKWNCICDCGNTITVDAHSLLNSKNPSCGCARMTDLTGKKFGMLTALYPTGERRRGFVMWHCACDCGNEVDVMSMNLVHGHSKSCGCRTRMMASLTHCIWKTPEEQRLAKIYHGMMGRCYCTTSKDYKYWGGRGIYVCEEWRNNKRAFIEWALSHGHQMNLSLDRIDVNGPYSPENCRWATAKEQANNRRNSVFVTVEDQKKTCFRWDKFFGLSNGCIWNKYRRFGKEYVEKFIYAHLHGLPEPPTPSIDERPTECREYCIERDSKRYETS